MQEYVMHKTYVPPSGNPAASLACCGEQPGVYEIRNRPPKPFVGPAGKLLDECFMMTKTIRRDLYMTNVIKDLDAPLKHYIHIDKRGKSTISTEGYQYIQELKAEIEKLNLNCIIAFGNTALLALTSRVGINKWRGSVLESTLVPGLKVVPTFHPATVIRPKCNYLNKPLICEDILRAKRESGFKEIRRIARNIRVKQSFDETLSILNHCTAAGRGGQTIGIDIEVINRELDCISFAWAAAEAISIPFRYNHGDYFTPDQELEVMKRIAWIIQDPLIPKAGANFIFDLQFMFNKYGIRFRGPLHCTQTAQKISYPDFPAGLDFVTCMYTDLPYYKQDGKQWMKMGAGTWEEWWNYNGIDGVVPVEAIPKQQEVLKKQGNIEVYNRHCQLIEPLTYMSERGIRIDVQGMMDYKEDQQGKLDTLALDLNKEVGHEINYNSPQQLMRYFYKELGFKPYKKRNANGQYTNTIDVDALKRLARQDVPAARIMLDIRGLAKRTSTYLNVGKVDKDGRYRSSYKPVGTDTGRLASGETIFGTGGNQQNWPHDLLRFFCFDEGYIGYSIDLSQIENRIVAYVGGVIEQIKAFEQGIDLHKLTASIILGKPYDQISGEDGSSDIGDGRQSERFWGKKGNHATNYDVGYKTFALKNEMPERKAKMILETIHRGYPQIRGGFQQLIQDMLFDNRTVTNLYGRNRMFLGPIRVTEHTPKNACVDTFRKAYAQLPQSTCADKITKEGINYIYYSQDLFHEVELLTQIHDSVVFQIPLSVPFKRHAEILLLVKKSLETPLDWHGTRIDTPADITIGFNMCKDDMIEIKSKDVPNDVDNLSDKLEGIYYGNLLDNKTSM